MARKTLSVLMLFTSLLFVHSGPVRSIGPPASFGTDFEAQTSLWIADRNTVVRADLEEVGQVVVIRFEETVSLLGTDAFRGSVWVVTSRSVSILDSQGALRITFPLPRDLTGEPVALEVHELDGSAWLAAGETLLKLHPVFGQLQRVEIGFPVRDLALDPKGSRIWVGTGTSEVQARELGEGAYLESLEPSESEEPVTVTSVAADAERGDLWVSFGEETHRYDAEGERMMSRPAGGYAEMLVAALGSEEHGVWAIEGSHLSYIDSQGSTQTTIVPFGEEPLLTMTPDPMTQSIWVSDGAGLVRYNRLGWELERYQVGPDAEIRDLALISTLEDTRAPSLHFAGPRDGETIHGQWPYIVLEYADHGSGVDPDTVELFLDSRPIAAHCSRDRERAVCRLRRPLELGAHTLSAWVADFSGNVSAPARIEIEVEEADETPGDEDSLVPDPPPWTEMGYTPRVRARGIRRDTPFVTTEGLAAIDATSGNLTLAIPLGQEYEVGPILKYSFQVAYNSNVWEAHQLCGFEETDLCSIVRSRWFSLPNAQSNAGLGWELHFGRLYAPEPPTGISGLQAVRWPNREPNNADENFWMYVAPDGATHLLYTLENRPAGAWYAKDSSRLRLRQVNSSRMEVDFPNGVKSVFLKTGNSPEGTNFCGGGISGCWRLSETVDPLGNRVAFSYSRGGSTETWTITDSTGRRHALKFAVNTAATQGGDGNSTVNWKTPNPWYGGVLDQWGDLRRVLTEVRLAAFNGTEAIHTLGYDKPSIARGCPQHGDLGEGIFTTAILNRITSPGLQPYQIFTEKPAGTINGCDSMSGKVTELRTPNRGRLLFQYQTWEHPTICDYGQDTQNPEFTYESLGVWKKHRVDASGNAEATWVYSSQLEYGSGHSPVISGPSCQHADRRRTTIVEPLSENSSPNLWKKTEIFTSVAQGPRIPSSSDNLNNWRVTDWGLPYDKDQPLASGDGSGNLFLGRQLYRCTNSAGTACGSPLVKTYYQYASEYQDCSKISGDRPDCYSRDSIKLRERTVYGDGHYSERINEQPDGAGNFDIVTTRSDFHDTRRYELITNYTVTGQDLGLSNGYVQVGNPSSYLPSASEPWILSLYDMQTTTATGQASYVKEFDFDPSTGLLDCERAWKNSGGRSGQDLVVFLVRGDGNHNRGLPITETVSGGDDANLGTGAICRVDNDGPAGVRYDIHHEYEFLQLSRSYLSGYPNWYEADIDLNTGLPRVTYNVSDQPTSYSFDALSRLTSIEPSASLGEAETEIVYWNPAGADPTMTETRRMGTTQLYQKITTYDHHGRLKEEQVRRPTGGINHEATIKTYAYDGPGHLIKESMWRDGDITTSNDTVYSQFEILGRPERITYPDGKVVERDYGAGKRRLWETIEQVRTSEGAFSSATTKIYRDGLGRPYLVQQPDGLYNLENTYDAYGQLIQAKRTASGFSQTRSYVHDGRGYRVRECHPELGSAGHGCVDYEYDAFGQIRRREDDARTLLYGYDSGARPVSVWEDLGAGGNRLWKEWTWGQTNVPGNFRRGRIETAVRHNYPIVDGQLIDDYAVQETYVYGGSLASISRRETLLRFEGVDQETFSTAFTWTPLGKLESVTYPDCVTTASNGTRYCDSGPGSGDVVAPNLTVTQTYNHDFVRAVTANLPLSADYEYADNLQVKEVSYANGARTVYQKDPWRMPRPRKITHWKGSTKHYGSGVYKYDGAGNMWQAGSDRYTYDKAGRLLSGTVKAAGSALREDYQYDPADNLVSVSVNGGGLQPQFYWGNTNRLRGGASDILYDAAGNMIAVGVLAGGGPRWELTYDAFDMQTSYVENPNAENMQFVSVYGPGDYRITTLDDLTGERTVTLRDLDARVLREWKVGGLGAFATWEHEKDYLYGPTGMWATRANDGEVHYLHRDHLGSTRTITDSLGNKAGRRDFYPYGYDARDGSPQYDERMAKFTGHERDPHNLTDYMLGRTYAYLLRRFMTPDPARDGWNLYGYVGGNPVNSVDPTGRVAKALTAAAREEIQAIAGGDASAVSFQDDGTLVVSATPEQLAANAGLAGLHSVANSEKVFGVVVGSSVDSSSGSVNLTQGEAMNLSRTEDQRLTSRGLTQRLPPEGFDGIVGVGLNADSVRTGKVDGLPASRTLIVFHELMENFHKTAGGQQYAPAHAAASRAEEALRAERPELEAFAFGAGPYTRRLP